QKLQEALDRLKMLQSQLIQAEKMSALGVLIAGIAHEINNPISFIHGNIGYTRSYVQSLIDLLNLYHEIYPNPDNRISALIKEIELDFIIDDLFKILDSMQVGSDRIHQIVSGLRTFSRVDESAYKAVDLHACLDSTLMLLQHRLKADSNRPEITVTKSYNQLPEILCFPGQLNQVFMNILVNAIDAIEELYIQKTKDENRRSPGHIKVSTFADTLQWVKVIISDNGLGMTEEIQQKIFNPFFTTKPVGKGTGMGMSISYQIIVEKHHGKLDCFSEVGKGTEFILELPADHEVQVV
ncbi:MAG: ATP-binding protein, partial [Cyanobacteria bacterium P01_F01_bin.86]